jgi:hypothetical protein
MKTIIAAILVLFMTGPVLAAPSRWYVGSALQYHALSEPRAVQYATASALSGSSQWPFGESNLDGMHYKGLGFEFQGGQISNVWSAFLGFRQTYTREYYHEAWSNRTFGGATDHEYHRTVWWYGSRLLLGGRLHVSLDRPELVKPFVGAGFSWGWIKQTQAEAGHTTRPAPFESDYESSRRTQISKITFGGFGEAGLMLRTNGPLMFTATVRYDQVHMDGDFKWPDGAVGDYTELAFQLGTIYQFRK